MRNQILGGRYRILDRIGEGGMANVYIALDQKLGRKVAIKVLHKHMAENDEIRKRFQLEAQAVSSLEHSNIVKIYDYSGTDSEQLWIVTEIIKGHNISEFVQHFAHNRLHPVVACCIVREVCKALQAAHDNGLVHRDIKPENVMLTTTGLIKLMDFGIAKDTHHNSMTQTGTFMGSPSYMSPEQIRGKDIDLRSDIYSLGVLFYEIITGRLPYAGNSMHDVVVKIIEGGFTPPRFFIPGLSPQVDAIICKAIAKQPSQRHAAATQLGSDIDAYLKSQGFDESHIELERFCADRKTFNARLLRKGQNAAKGGDDTDKNAALNEPTRRIQPVPSTKTSYPFAVSKEQVEPTQILRPGATQAIEHIRAHNQSALEKPAPAAVTPAWSRKSVAPVNAPRRDHMVPSQFMPPRPAANNRKKARSPAQQQRQRRPQQPSPRQAVVKTYYRPGVLSSFVGAFTVGLLLFAAALGFWSMSQRLDQVQVKPDIKQPAPTNRPRSHTPAAVPERDTAITAPEAKSSETNAANVETTSTPASKKNAEKRSKRDKTTSPRLANVANDTTTRSETRKKTNADTAERGTGSAATTAGKQSTPPGVASTPNMTTPATSTVAIAPKRPIAADDKPAANDDAFIMLSSQPAAEIFVNGKRYGTTLDETTNSGWLKVKAGNNYIELRRSNHSTHKVTIHAKAGERTRVPNVILQAASIHPLKIRAAPLPVTVAIMNADGRILKQFSMTTAWHSEYLPTGRYRIRITHKDKVMEREFWLPDPAGSLTVNGEFRIKAEQ